jgi:RHS repeat-associated protein
MIATQEQNGEKLSYNRDPASRIREVIASGTVSTTTKYHYAGEGDAPAWTITTTGSWTRNITGINGSLAAVETNGKEPQLQLQNLHGDIIGTAAISETESKLTPSNEASEYGVPHTTTSGYAWLGADELSTELPTGIMNMGARSYIPQLGRFEQTDPQPGGSANAYAYTSDDPVNESDPSGESSTITYNYEAAETGAAQAGLPEMYGAPGAVTPPPADLQAEEEFAAHPP